MVLFAALATGTAVVLTAIVKGMVAAAITVDQIIAIVASLGACAAAVATYLTVREMRAGRIAAARARLTTPGSDLEIRYLWRRSKNIAPDIDTHRAIIRNASAGVAHNIRASWECDFDISTDDIELIDSWLRPGQHVAIEGSVDAFYEGSLKTSHVVAAKDDVLYLGDLGPGQDVFCSISQPILGMVFLKWAALLALVARGEKLRYDDVPLVRLSLIHDSPYQRNIRDELLIRFELSDHELKVRAKKNLAASLGGKWETFKITVAFETTTRSLYDIPKVVVSPGG